MARKTLKTRKTSSRRTCACPTAHPRNHPPVHTVPEFPFANCWHWLLWGLEVRVRAMPDGGVFDATNAVHLPPEERTVMGFYWNRDINRRREMMHRHALEQVGFPAAALSTDGRLDDIQETWNDADSEEVVFHNYADRSPTPSAGLISVERLSYTATGSSAASIASWGAIADMNIFGDPDDAGEYLPLVDFSLELQEMKAEDIPSPLGMYDEYLALLM
ncbi:hypothetical protein OH77DRAFT_824922 [Trametes cingulata]|nr:hypothetical protein OH77DRAFT_824922 [Trametes cingulata]